MLIHIIGAAFLGALASRIILFATHKLLFKYGYIEKSSIRRQLCLAIGNASLFSIAAEQIRSPLMLISAFLFITALVILALIDLRIKLLPDFITLPLLLSGLALSLAGITITIGDSLVGMALGYSILLGTHFLYKMLTNRDGVGFGDIKLMAAIGAWTGWHHTIDVIFIASITAALTGCFFLLIKKTNKNDYLAFGPHLIAATIFMLLAKDFYQ